MRPTRRARNRRGQRVGRPPLALMRFVEDRDVVGRQESAADGEIEKEQRVIDDDDIGILRFVALLEKETIAKMFAELADAVVGVGVELFPLVATRNERQFRPIAGLRCGRPIPTTLASNATARQAGRRACVRTSACRGSGCGL